MWIYSSDFRKPRVYETDLADSRIIITFNDNDLKNHGIIWILEDFASPTYEQNYGSIIRKPDKLNKFKDTRNVKILVKNPKTNEFTDSVGVIRFFKVKDKNVN